MSETGRTRRMQNAKEQPKVMRDLEKLFDHIRILFTQHDDYMRRNEYRTRICLIDPVLRMLGWNVESPEMVELEFELIRPEGKRADYVLKVKNQYVAIVEAKSFGSDLESKSKLKQARNYARNAGVWYFILTDGNQWKLHSLDQDIPEVELDISSDTSPDTVTKALALRQPDLDLGRKWSLVPKPIFKIPASDSRGDKPPIKASQSPPEDSIWYPVSKLSVSNSKRPPAWIKFPDNDVRSFVRPGWIGVPFNLVRWLVDTRKLHKDHLPVNRESGKALIVDSPIGNPREVRKGFYMNRGRGSRAHFSDALDLMRQFKIDPATVFVNFGDSSRRSRPLTSCKLS